MLDWFRKLSGAPTNERKLIRHTALAVRDGEIGFIATDVEEKEFRRKLQEVKGEFVLRTKVNGDVEAFCKSCRIPLIVVQKDQLHWFRCSHCQGISFSPTANVNRDVQFAIHDDKPFECESNYVRQLPPGLVPPFSADEVGDIAWEVASGAVIPLSDRPVGGRGLSGRQEVERAIEPYVQKARLTYPDAKRRFLAGLPDGAAFFTTVRLRDDVGGIEVVFVQVMTIALDRISGIIESDITAVTGFSKGQPYTFSEDEVLDWTIANSDGTQEGNIVGRFLMGWRKSHLSSPPAEDMKTGFLFTVEHVFYDAQRDRVLLAGVVIRGTTKVGDALTVQCQSGDVTVVLENILTRGQEMVQKVPPGQEVCLVLKGLLKEQPAPGDHVVSVEV